ncbi:MAG: hybrid sensor histidine kinase/response regulator [Hyphomicrobiales bacterium]|nr:hybrid sensor histidine kinase/response regulator [Hyphomicrobiales bacterium]
MQISDVSRFASVTQGFDALDLVEPEGDGLAAPRPISVLVIEDDDTDFHITQRTLLMMDTFDATIHHARSLEEAREAVLGNSFDVALVDFCLGLETGARALQDLGGRNGAVAPILLTGMPGQDVKQIALRAGAIYCIDKNQLSPALLENTIRCTLHTYALERKLQDLVIALERANRAKSDFFTKIGHDLKTPLNAIIGYSDALSSETFGPVGQAKYKEAGESIKESGLHLLEVINNLIQHSLSQGGMAEAAFQFEDVNELVARAISMIDILRRRHGHTLTRRLSGAPVHVNCHRSVLTQAILNILSNAIKYTPKGGAISVEVRETSRQVEIRIADNGIGMNENDLAVALAPFGRVELPARAVQEGTGIGLPIVRDIMASHQGQLEIESAPGKGTTVILRLPIAVAAWEAA